MNQSRPRRLWREGAGAWRGSGRLPCPLDRPPLGSRIGSDGCLDERTNSLLLRVQGLDCNGSSLPEAPSTTIGLSSWYSGAAFT